MTYDGRRMTLIMDSKEQQRLMVVWWRSFDSNCQSVTLCVGWTLLVCTPLCRTSCSKYTNRSSIFCPSFLLVEGRKAHMSCVSFSSWVNQPVSLIHPSIAEPFIRPPHIQRFYQTYIVLSIPPSTRLPVDRSSRILIPIHPSSCNISY